MNMKEIQYTFTIRVPDDTDEQLVTTALNTVIDGAFPLDGIPENPWGPWAAGAVRLADTTLADEWTACGEPLPGEDTPE